LVPADLKSVVQDIHENCSTCIRIVKYWYMWKILKALHVYTYHVPYVFIMNYMYLSSQIALAGWINFVIYRCTVLDIGFLVPNSWKEMERKVTNSTSVDMMEDTIENNQNDGYFCCFHKIWQLFWTCFDIAG
jgi:hypothetical protein